MNQFEILQRIVDLSDPERGEFSITLENKDRGTYYVIAIGKHKYLTPSLFNENLFNALTYITSSIRQEEGW